MNRKIEAFCCVILGIFFMFVGLSILIQLIFLSPVVFTVLSGRFLGGAILFAIGILIWKWGIENF